MTLTNKEKIDIINQHISNSEKNQYNLELSLLTEQQKENNDNLIASLQKQINDESKKQLVLNEEKSKLTE